MARRVHKVLAEARRYQRKGYVVIPVHHGDKKPAILNWTSVRLTDDELAAYFGEGEHNIGLLLGEPSEWLTDVDIDCDEALQLSDEYLIKTQFVFGRRSALGSHRGYVARNSRPRKFTDPIDGETLVEIRSTGQQTVAPVSEHVSGEMIEFENNGEPTEITREDLERMVGELAAATFLARHWEKGSRDEISASLVGVLVRTVGWDEKKILGFLSPILRLVEDEEATNRLRKIRRTINQQGTDIHLFGLPKLADLLGHQAVDQLLKWIPPLLDSSPPRLRTAYEIATEEITPRYIHKPYLEEGVLAVLSGDYGVYKTFLALDLALSAAAGLPWPREE